jgi:hypothetical protein
MSKIPGNTAKEQQGSRPQRCRAAPLAPAQTRRPAGRRLAKGAAPAIRPRAEVRPGEPRRRSGLLRVLGVQPGEPSPLPGGDSRRTAGDNHCSCPDFATNDLGTCKHIEFTLAQISARPGGKTALARGFQGSFSELFLDYSRTAARPPASGQRFPARSAAGGAAPVRSCRWLAVAAAALCRSAGVRGPRSRRRPRVALR